MELRAGFAADLPTQVYRCTLVTRKVTEEYELRITQSRRIRARAIYLIVQDFEEINIEHLQMVEARLQILKRGCRKD